jgi:hypothetical protein
VGFHDVLHKPVGLEEFGLAIRDALESKGGKRPGL